MQAIKLFTAMNLENREKKTDENSRQKTDILKKKEIGQNNTVTSPRLSNKL